MPTTNLSTAPTEQSEASDSTAIAVKPDVNKDENVEAIEQELQSVEINGQDGTAQPEEVADQPQEPTEEELNPTLAAFMLACQNGDVAAVTDLISSGKVKASDTFSQGITGLHWACINNRITVVKYLIDNEHSKADPNAMGGTLNATPLHWACRNGLVYVVDYLLSHSDADPTLKDSQNYNALHLAVHSSNITLVIYMLLSCVCTTDRIYIDEPDSINCTPLHWAAYQGDILTVNALLKYGADVNKVDNSLMTPLHWAFIRGYKSVLASLLDAGSDIFGQNDKGKDSFAICKDMNCEETWLLVLSEADRDPKNHWLPRHHLVSARVAKIATFLTPYVVLPIVFNMCSLSDGYGIPKMFGAAFLFAASLVGLHKLVLPVYLRKEKPLFKSPYLAGTFSATAFWTVATWFFAELPTVWAKRFFWNVFFAISVGVLSFTFFKTMFLNPGVVPVPTDNTIILEQIRDLIRLGRFDTENFCVNSFVRKPLRSKYSRFNDRLIARFDHYCPWVYNDIGVRNHKLFVTFAYTLTVAIIAFIIITREYFEMYSEKMGYESDDEDTCWSLLEELCLGYKHNHFVFNLLIWCIFQLVWVSFLCVVQTFQIFKGLTTWEFSTVERKMTNSGYNHSTVPRDFDGPIPPSSIPAEHTHARKTDLGTCMKLLGLDQFVMTVKIAVLSIFKKTTQTDSYSALDSFEIPTDFGWKQNWLDFWFLGETNWRNLMFLPIEGENNLNGSVVDYYKLYEYPAKAVGGEAV